MAALCINSDKATVIGYLSAFLSYLPLIKSAIDTVSFDYSLDILLKRLCVQNTHVRCHYQLVLLIRANLFSF